MHIVCYNAPCDKVLRKGGNDMKKKTTEAFLKELKEKGVIIAYCRGCNAHERKIQKNNGGSGHSMC